MTECSALMHVTDQAVKDAYELVVEPVDPVAVIVTCARGGTGRAAW